MAQTDDGALEGPHAPVLRAAPLDAALLVAVHRGLEAVPASPLDGPEAPEAPEAPGAPGAPEADSDAWSDRLTRRCRA